MINSRSHPHWHTHTHSHVRSTIFGGVFVDAKLVQQSSSSSPSSSSSRPFFSSRSHWIDFSVRMHARRAFFLLHSRLPSRLCGERMQASKHTTHPPSQTHNEVTTTALQWMAYDNCYNKMKRGRTRERDVVRSCINGIDQKRYSLSFRWPVHIFIVGCWKTKFYGWSTTMTTNETHTIKDELRHVS